MNELTHEQKIVLNKLLLFLEKSSYVECGEFAECEKEESDIGIFADWNHINDKIAECEKEESDIGIFADWNHINDKIIEKYFDNKISCEWYDEWTYCTICSKYVRTSPTHYGWERKYVLTDNDLICQDCYEDHLDYIIESYKNSPNKILPSYFKNLLNKKGFECYSRNGLCNRFETGMHIGQNDDPIAVIKTIQKQHKNLEFIFVTDHITQFSLHWNIFIKNQEKEKPNAEIY